MDRLQCVVQFMHPGFEARVVNGHSPWNTGSRHRRKFLVQSGAYLDGTNRVRQATLAFWGEWEPPSTAIAVRQRVVAEWGLGPCYLHHPYFPAHGGGLPRTRSTGCSTSEPGCQNTDPFVFGDEFLYCNCMQDRWASRSRCVRIPTQLQSLAAGSIILFGSHSAGEFMLDTVFVVGDSHPYQLSRNRAEIERITPPLYHRATLDHTPPDWPYTLYRGAMHSARRGSLFSFVPCNLAEAVPDGFPRPILRATGALRDVIVPGRRQWFRPTPVSTTQEMEAIWAEVVRQVTDSGCRLGVRIRLPLER